MVSSRRRDLKRVDRRPCQRQVWSWLLHYNKALLSVVVFVVCRSLLILSRDSAGDVLFDSLFLSLPPKLQQDHNATMPLPTSSGRIPVFYNVFVKNEQDASRVSALVESQLSLRRAQHFPIYVHTIGYNLSIPDTIPLQHHEDGSEMVTLQSMWEYCRDHRDDKVVYIHSKGSYHDTEANGRFRTFLTVGAFSDECSNVSPSLCNVCSARFSPLPHPHTPGNMFLAQCSYVRTLKEPRFFERLMQFAKRKGDPVCTGRLRYAAEHYIHSHFSVKVSSKRFGGVGMCALAPLGGPSLHRSVSSLSVHGTPPTLHRIEPTSRATCIQTAAIHTITRISLRSS
jgi:hypothetical protein